MKRFSSGKVVFLISCRHNDALFRTPYDVTNRCQCILSYMYDIIDTLISEFNSRFTNAQAMIPVLNLVPSAVVAAVDFDKWKETVVIGLQPYSHFLPCLVNLDTELRIWRNCW